MLETSKQALLFNFGGDLTFFVILRFSEDFVTISDRQEKFRGI